MPTKPTHARAAPSTHTDIGRTARIAPRPRTHTGATPTPVPPLPPRFSRLRNPIRCDAMHRNRKHQATERLCATHHGFPLSPFHPSIHPSIHPRFCATPWFLSVFFFLSYGASNQKFFGVVFLLGFFWLYPKANNLNPINDKVGFSGRVSFWFGFGFFPIQNVIQSCNGFVRGEARGGGAAAAGAGGGAGGRVEEGSAGVGRRGVSRSGV